MAATAPSLVNLPSGVAINLLQIIDDYGNRLSGKLAVNFCWTRVLELLIQDKSVAGIALSRWTTSEVIIAAPHDQCSYLP
jgi:hypothetical protein